MDLMQIRRQMMGVIAMAGSGRSLLDSAFEFVSSATVTEESYEITFTNVNYHEGGYILISEPIGIPAVAQQQSNNEIVLMSFFSIIGISSPVVRNSHTIASKKTASSASLLDYWGASASVDISNDTITTRTTQNSTSGLMYYPGYTYYLYRTKLS